MNGDYRYQVFLVLDDMITTSKADQIQFNLKWRERTNDCWLNIIVSLFDVTSQTISFISNIFNGRGKDPFSIMAFSTIFTIFYCFVWHFLPQPRFFSNFLWQSLQTVPWNHMYIMTELYRRKIARSIISDHPGIILAKLVDVSR